MRSSFILHPSSFRSGFSLTELLIVITLIVIVLALALPAFNVITGSKSADAAQNQISALLGRARNEAVGVQEPRGVFFFLDPATDRYCVALIQQVKYGDATPPVAPGTIYNSGDYEQVGNSNYFVCTTDGTTVAPSAGGNWEQIRNTASVAPSSYVDLVRDVDILKLPKGVGVQVICDAKITTPVGSPPTRTTDGYLRVGAIMFDSSGKLLQQDLSVACGGLLGQTMKLAGNTTNYTSNSDYPDQNGVLKVARSAFGFILYDRETLKAQPFFTDNDYSTRYPILTAVNNYGNGSRNSPSGEGQEELWLDDNSVPILINRYNGTLLRGE